MQNIIISLLLTIISFNVSANHGINSETALVLTQTDIESYGLVDFDELIIDDERLIHLVVTLTEKLSIEPINAYIDESGVIIDEVPGVTLNREKFLDLFYDYFYGKSIGEFEVPISPIYPRVTSELLAEIYDETLSSFQTFYNAANEERSHNIQLSTREIDNHVLFPGERFSFNQVVGERTIEKGYQKAPVIVRGEFSEDIGGGICQVSSTLFNAVMINDIQMLERYSHSRSVPYVPPGKDAAVSWLGPDFVFQNNNAYPILIKAKAINGVLEIKLYARGNANAISNN